MIMSDEDDKVNPDNIINYKGLIEFSRNSIAKEWAAYSSSYEIDTIKICSSLHGGMLDYPKKVSKYMGESIERMESTLNSVKTHKKRKEPKADPVIEVTDEGKNVRFKKSDSGNVSKSFLDMIVICAEQFREHIIKMSLDIIKSGDMQTLYVITSSGSFIRNRLWYYDQFTGSSSKEK